MARRAESRANTTVQRLIASRTVAVAVNKQHALYIKGASSYTLLTLTQRKRALCEESRETEARRKAG